MTLSLEQQESHFETHADDIVTVLREYARRWGAQEQLEDDPPDDTVMRRGFFGYEYPTETNPAHVWLKLWIGAAGRPETAREGRAYHLHNAPTDYVCAVIDVATVPEHGDEYMIDGKHHVHSTSELGDRIKVMWNADYWKVRHEFVEENAELYPKFVLLRDTFDNAVKPIATTLNKIGKATDAEPQTDNTPDPNDNTGVLGSLLGGGTRRSFVGYRSPAFRLDDKGKASITRAVIFMDIWNGKKGTITAGSGSRLIEHAPKSNPTSVRVDVVPGGLRVAGTEAAARDPKNLSKRLVDLYRNKQLGL